MYFSSFSRAFNEANRKLFLEGGSPTLIISGRCSPFPQNFEQVLSQVTMYFVKFVTLRFIILYSMVFLVP